MTACKAGAAADAIAQYLSMGVAQRQELLETVNVIARLKSVLAVMNGDRQAA